MSSYCWIGTDFLELMSQAASSHYSLSHHLQAAWSCVLLDLLVLCFSWSYHTSGLLIPKITVSFPLSLLFLVFSVWAAFELGTLSLQAECLSHFTIISVLRTLELWRSHRTPNIYDVDCEKLFSQLHQFTWLKPECSHIPGRALCS